MAAKKKAKKKSGKGKKGNAKRAAKKAKGPKRTTAESVGATSKADRELLKKAGKREVSGGIWKPEAKGDSIVGDVLTYQKQVKGKFKPQDVITLAVAGGVRTIFANVVLEQELAESKVKVGDRICIQYKGTRPTGKGRPLGLFVCVNAGKSKTRR